MAVETGFHFISSITYLFKAFTKHERYQKTVHNVSRVSVVIKFLTIGHAAEAGIPGDLAGNLASAKIPNS